jgi:hypothetical protein
VACMGVRTMDALCLLAACLLVCLLGSFLYLVFVFSYIFSKRE